MDHNGRRAIGIISPGVLMARLVHKDFGVEFEVVIGIDEKPLPGPETIIGRVNGQEKIFDLIYSLQLRKSGVKEDANSKERETVYNTVSRELYFDLVEIYELLL